MSQLTVGQLLEVLKQLPEDAPVYKASENRAWRVTFERMQLKVWPRTSGHCLLIGGGIFCDLQESLQKFGVDVQPLTPGMELPALPEPSDVIEALEVSGWPTLVSVMQGKSEVGYRSRWEEFWEEIVGPLPEWANIVVEDGGEE